MEESMEMEVEKNSDYYDRYSRQYFTFGKQAMNNLGKSNVFISGIGGLGVEIAKCVALAGSRSITLHDTTAVSYADLSTQYYLNETNIGQNRAACSIEKLRELNPYVRMELDQQDLSQCDLSFLSKFNCVILTEVPLSVQLKVNQFCRSNKIPFIMADAYGLFAWCFVDFGDHFVCFDKNGEAEKQVFLGGINVISPTEAEVTTLDANLHDLEDGDVIRFVEVKGMGDINDHTFKIRNTTPTTFRIDIDTTKYGPYVSGGLILQVKQETVFQFKSLEESLKSPSFLDTDFSEDKFMSSIHVQYAMRALHEFKANNGLLPRPWNNEDAQIMLALANKIASELKNGFEGQVNENIVNKLSYTCRGNIIPITATMGGFVAQEVVKGVSGKYSPLNQWLFFDGLEVVCDATVADSANFQPEGNRNDGNVICIGKKTFEKIQNMKLFMVGAGAIGCEMIKNYAMLGLSGGNGNITITDNDIIEKSNLNRQFLFREKDIRSPKAVTAGKAALVMNPSLHITANCDKVCADTEHIYSDNFFQSNHIIVNALDNIQARLYMDQRSVSNTRPLLESGTMGTKGHVQVILPHLTETYADTVDPPEQGFPYCLIHSFPSNISHTIFWARDRFHAFFVEKPTELYKFLSERTAFNNSIKLGRVSIPILKYINKMLDRPILTFSECVRIARVKFERLFNLRIKQILVTYPPNAVDKDGKLFWTLPKRQPTPFDFDPNNEHHVDFLRHFSSILAHIFQIEYSNEDLSTTNLVKNCEGIVLPTFVPSQKTIITDESIKEKPKEEVDPHQYEILSNEVLNKIVPDYLKDKNLRVEEFEKDDDFNHHVDFMTASSNIRAMMYGIAATDRMETKRIAGKIIPAIATTTTMVAGLVSLEIIKIAHGGLKVDKFKSMSLNLALPVFQMFEPSGPKKFPIVGTKAFYTAWDSWEVKDSTITLSDFCQSFQDKYNLTVTGVVQGTSTVYMSMFPAHRQRLNKRISDLLKDIGVVKDVVELVVTFEDEDGGDVDGPIIKFWNASK